MPRADFYHETLLPPKFSLAEAQRILTERFGILIGVDEAGRGPLAGPVVAAAAVLKSGAELPKLLNDSKKLSEAQREKIFEKLPSVCEFYGIGEASAEEIDEIGILNADFLAMRRAIFSSDSHEANFRNYDKYKILVDGNLYIRELPQEEQMPIIKGDGRVACIAAASIFAKVHRDRTMRKFAEKYPQYGFEKHKGYGTAAHLEAIKKFGMCEIHRKSFRV